MRGKKRYDEKKSNVRHINKTLASDTFRLLFTNSLTTVRHWTMARARQCVSCSTAYLSNVKQETSFWYILCEESRIPQANRETSSKPAFYVELPLRCSEENNVVALRLYLEWTRDSAITGNPSWLLHIIRTLRSERHEAYPLWKSACRP